MIHRAATAARTFSGIQPTGLLHLGNYFGAVKCWVDDVAKCEAGSAESRLFAIVDLHAMTSPGLSADGLRAGTNSMGAALLACGLDAPRKCLLFQQSSVPQHTELAWILTCAASVERLSNLTQYKEKSAKLKSTPLGLFIYPVLQSADILLYKASDVPVGEDNVQNLEMAQRLRASFNKKYSCDFFPFPNARVTKDTSCRIRSLREPLKKMSKSDEDKRSCIYITDSADVVLEKCKKAVTDGTSAVSFEPETRPGVANLLTIHSSITGQSPEEICRDVSHLNTGQYKLRLAEVINEHLAPIRQKIDEYESDMGYVQNVLSECSARAQQLAEDTMQEVRKIVGLK